MDQAGEYDWSLSHLGKINFVSQVSNSSYVVGSQKGGISLMLGNGKTLWRRILEGKVQLEASGGFTVSLCNNTLSVWKTGNGQLQWEKPMKEVSSFRLVTAGLRQVLAVVSGTQLSLFAPETGEKLSSFKVAKGAQLVGRKLEVATQPFNITRIDIKTSKTDSVSGKLKGEMLCLHGGCINFSSETVEIYQDGKLKQESWSGKVKQVIPSANLVVTQDFQVFQLENLSLKKVAKLEEGLFSGSESSLFHLNSQNVLTKVSLSDLSVSKVQLGLSSKAQEFWGFDTAEGEFLGLITCEDYSFVSVDSKSVKWIRQEALGHTNQVHFVELPSSTSHYSNAYFESLETSDTWANLPLNLINRVKSQVLSVKEWYEEYQNKLEHELERDHFGFKKLVLCATEPGVLYAIHSLSGKIVWKQSIGSGELKKVVQEEVEKIILVLKENKQVKLLTLSTTSGEVLEETSYLWDLLDVIAYENNVVLVNNQYQTKLVRGQVPELYFYSIDSKSNEVSGYFLGNTTSLLWRFYLPESEQIKQVSKGWKKEHQEAIPTGTSRLLYKYSDHNIVALASTEGEEMFVYIFNGVTGRLVTKFRQDSVKEPIHMHLHENNLLVHYWNTKHTRYEILSIEMFQPKVQSSAAEVISEYLETSLESYSAFTAEPPVVFAQVYTFPTGVKALSSTVSKQGITKGNLLMLLTNNQVYSLDLALLSPRRKDYSGDFHQESLPAYSPSIGVKGQDILTYYLQLEQLEGVVSTPTHLESTSLVCAFGLDIFLARVTPEKSFDMLTEDFSKLSIVLTILVLVVLNVGVQKWFASKKTKEKFNS